MTGPLEDQKANSEHSPRYAVTRSVDLEDTSYYEETNKRLNQTRQTLEIHHEELQTEGATFAQSITNLLENLLELGNLDGLTIASADGLLIAETKSLENAEVMAAIGSVFEYVADRAQHSNIVSEVDEMTIRGTHGELAIVRYFPNLDRRFFLMAYAKKLCSHRRITNLALKKCGALLEKKFPSN